MLISVPIGGEGLEMIHSKDGLKDAEKFLESLDESIDVNIPFEYDWKMKKYSAWLFNSPNSSVYFAASMRILSNILPLVERVLEMNDYRVFSVSKHNNTIEILVKHIDKTRVFDHFHLTIHSSLTSNVKNFVDIPVQIKLIGRNFAPKIGGIAGQSAMSYRFDPGFLPVGISQGDAFSMGYFCEALNSDRKRDALVVLWVRDHMRIQKGLISQYSSGPTTFRERSIIMAAGL